MPARALEVDPVLMCLSANFDHYIRRCEFKDACKVYDNTQASESNGNPILVHVIYPMNESLNLIHQQAWKNGVRQQQSLCLPFSTNTQAMPYSN